MNLSPETNTKSKIAPCSRSPLCRLSKNSRVKAQNRLLIFLLCVLIWWSIASPTYAQYTFKRNLSMPSLPYGMDEADAGGEMAPDDSET